MIRLENTYIRRLQKLSNMTKRGRPDIFTAVRYFTRVNFPIWNFIRK